LQQNGQDSKQSHKSSKTLTVSECSSGTGRESRDTPISGISRLWPTPSAGDAHLRCLGTIKVPEKGQTHLQQEVYARMNQEIKASTPSAQLPLFPADSPASRSARPGSEAAQTMTVTSGRRCLESYEKLHRGGSWQKTFLASCLLTTAWSSRLCYLTWSLRDTRRSAFIFQLRARVLRTYETESLLWATPHAIQRETPTDGRYKWSNKGFYLLPDGRKKTTSLQDQVKMWPTPDASVTTGGAADEATRRAQGHSVGLHDAVRSRMWPTPKGRDGRWGGSESEANRHTPDLNYQARESVGMTGGQLNPTWVEWLQGFPLGWTDLELLGTP
jgi:hypothetical protein